MRVVVIGGGLVGVTTAYALTRAGHQVTLLERHDTLAAEASHANGGQIAASHAVPWAAPHVPWLALKWLARADAPFSLRLRADPEMWQWLAQFLRNCRPGQYRRNALPMLRLAHYNRTVLARLREETGIAYDGSARGILSLYREPRALQAAQQHAALAREAGIRVEMLDAAACLEREPALRTADAPPLGGLFAPDDESGDAGAFTLALADEAVAAGAAMQTGVDARGFVRAGQRILAVATSAGAYEADAFVLAAGTGARALGRGLGLSLPIYPVKGYSVTVPVSAAPEVPQVSITDESRRLVISRLGDRLRAAGIAELSGYDQQVAPRRAAAVLKSLRSLFPQAADYSRPAYWACLRPMTTSGPPILGATPYANLYLNVGHGACGWALACGAADVLWAIVEQREPPIPLDGLTLTR